MRGCGVVWCTAFLQQERKQWGEGSSDQMLTRFSLLTASMSADRERQHAIWKQMQDDEKGREEERRGTRAETDAERERRGTERENKGESGSDGYQVCGRKLSCGYIWSPKRRGGTQSLTTRNRRRTEPAGSLQRKISSGSNFFIAVERDRRGRCGWVSAGSVVLAAV